MQDQLRSCIFYRSALKKIKLNDFLNIKWISPVFKNFKITVPIYQKILRQIINPGTAG